MASGDDITIESDKFFEDVYNHVFDGIALAGADSMRFSNCNDAFCAMLRCGKGEIIGASIFAVHPPESRKEIEDAFMALKNGVLDLAKDIPVLTKDGRRIYADIGSVKVSYRGEPHMLATFHDVTERKEAENALRESEANLNEIQRMVQLGNWTWDVRTGKVDWSPEVYRIFHLDPDIFAPTIDSILMLSPWPEDHERDKELIRRAAESREKGEYEQRFLRPDGSVGYYQSTFQGKYAQDGALERIVGTVMDITERKRSEEALRESEEKYRTLVESMQDAVIRCDPDGAVVFASPSAARLFGRPSAESLIGLHIERDLGLSCADGRGLIEALEENGKLTQREAEFVLPGGGAVNALINGQFYRDKEGKALGFDCVCSDITERKRMEAEKSRLEEMLLHSQKMESIGRLAGGIAHDFNNLLTAIIGNADMAMEILDPDGRPHSLITQVIKAAESAANLTKQLLAFSRKQVIEPKTVDLNEIVSDMRKMIATLVGENVEFEIAPCPGLYAVRADPGQIEQVIMNLAVNAKDAMPSGGRLTIETSNVSLDEEYCRGRSDAVPGRYALLSMSDTGVGMDEEAMSHLFEPFYTTKAKGRGTGLGLATVYGIIHQNGGHVQVRSAPGKGTAFMLYLPSTQEAVSSASGHVLARESSGGTETILVAEDNPQVLEFSRSSLAKLGYAVMTAMSGEEAVAISSAYDGPIDLFVTDIILPGMNGKETAARISKDRPRMKVLYNSGYTAEVIDKQGVLEEGVNFIPKPFTSRDLGQKVREVLDGK